MKEITKEEFNKSLTVAKEVACYFDGTIIGSALVEKLIPWSLINDIDILVIRDNYFKIQQYFYNNGFKETKKGFKLSGYLDTIGSCIFIKDDYIPIHVNLTANDYKADTTVSFVLKSKIERYSESDQKQIMSLLMNNKCKNW